MFVRENEYNYLTDMNNAKVIQCSSYEKGCNPKNIIDNASKTIWLSLEGFPQSVTFDLTLIIKKPKPFFQYWGIYCWHAYSSNPKEVELQCSGDNEIFESLGYYQLHFKPGMQIFEIEKKEALMKPEMSNYIKMIIHKACGGNKAYINQLFLFDNFDSMNSGRLHVTPSKPKTDDSESNNIITPKKKEEVGVLSQNERYSSENYEEKDKNQFLYDSSKENENVKQKNTYQTPLRNNNDEKIELNTLIKETESDIEVEPSNHNKILSALQHMKRIEKVFKSKGLTNRQNEFKPMKEERKQKQSNVIIPQNYNSRAHKKQTQYTHYASNLSTNQYQKLEKKLNDLNNHIKTMNFDINYDSVYSSNRTRATSNFNKTLNEYNTHYANLNDITANNIDSNYNKDCLTSKKTKEDGLIDDSLKSIEIRMDKVENKVMSIEKEMGQLKDAFIDLNEKMEKKTERNNQLNSLNEDGQVEREKIEEQSNQKEISEELLNDNYQEENNEEMLSKKNFEIEINTLIDQKFDLLANQIEYQIYNKYLNPSVKSFEKKIQETMNQMKKTANKIISRNNKSNSSASSICNHSNGSSLSYHSNKYSNKNKLSSQRRNYKELNRKYDKITELGEKLYAKLLEKQLKLEQSTQYLNQL